MKDLDRPYVLGFKSDDKNIQYGLFLYICRKICRYKKQKKQSFFFFSEFLTATTDYQALPKRSHYTRWLYIVLEQCEIYQL